MLYGGVRLLDFHSHILPQMDDGSQSVAESVRMLQTLADADVEYVALTPHFYAGVDSPESFLSRRCSSYAMLEEALLSCESRNMPALLLGAEVEYFEGIAVLDELSSFQIGDSRCLLLEMPPGPWTSRMVDDILELNNRPDCCVVLAHVERYLGDQSDETLQRLKQSGVTMQSNTAFFLNRWTVSKALRMYDHGLIHVLGSDCHNTSTRPPDIGRAAAVIARRAGLETLKRMMNTARSLLVSE